jgi:hypothetical protein
MIFAYSSFVLFISSSACSGFGISVVAASDICWATKPGQSPSELALQWDVLLVWISLQIALYSI